MNSLSTQILQEIGRALALAEAPLENVILRILASQPRQCTRHEIEVSQEEGLRIFSALVELEQKLGVHARVAGSDFSLNLLVAYWGRVIALELTTRPALKIPEIPQFIVG